jgi:hypothetical protein
MTAPTLWLLYPPHQDVYGTLQSAYGDLRLASDPTTRVVVDGRCNIIRTFPNDTIATFDTPAKRYYEAVYSPSAPYGQNGVRMGLYFQMVYLVAQNPLAHGGIRLDKGWGLLILLHQASRAIEAWGGTGNNTLWEEKRGLLGMDLFPRVGGGVGVPYSQSQDVRADRCLWIHDWMLRICARIAAAVSACHLIVFFFLLHAPPLSVHRSRRFGGTTSCLCWSASLRVW